MTVMNTPMSNDNTMTCGQRLRSAREQAGWSLEQASAQSHMPIRALAALESGDWSRLGAPVFVRGQLRSYARLLGVDADALLAHADIAPVRPVELITREHTPGWERFFSQLGSKIVYVVMTLGLAIPVYMVATRSPVPEQPAQAAQVEAAPGAELLPRKREPVAASMASLPKPTPAALSFQFDGESWVQFYAPDGSTLEKGLMKAGDRREFAAGQLGRAVVGNVSDVQVQHAGQPVDMTPWLKSNVARFAVSSDGLPVDATK